MTPAAGYGLILMPTKHVATKQTRDRYPESVLGANGNVGQGRFDSYRSSGKEPYRVGSIPTVGTIQPKKGARMAYTTVNFKSKAALKRAIAEGQEIGAFPPGIGTVPDNGTVTLEGPHYPAPHTWYATATLRDGVIVSVK